MTDLQRQVAELENAVADCEIMSSLAADPKVRAVNRKQATELLEQAWALREATPVRLTA